MLRWLIFNQSMYTSITQGFSCAGRVPRLYFQQFYYLINDFVDVPG